MCAQKPPKIEFDRGEGRDQAATVGVVRRIGIGAANAALRLASAYSMVAPDELDSLPCSDYPMFAHPRERFSEFLIPVHLVDGAEHALEEDEATG